MYKQLKSVRPSVKRFRSSEDGALTVFGLYVMMIMATLSIFSLEVANLMSARSQLQMSADSAAHAALYYRDTHTAEESKAMAVRVAEHAMPTTNYGEVLSTADIKFGTWDYVDQTFKIDDTSKDAVMVTTKRTEGTHNAIQGFVSNWVGKDTWGVTTPAVFTTYRPMCFREGFVADGVVDIQSNNGFSNGFCVHSNSYVSMNSNNTFEPGTVVSMPNINDIDLPQSGFKTNDGLETALRSGSYRLRIINRLPDIIAGLEVGDAKYTPDYITTTTPIKLNGKKFTVSDFTPGRIHTVNCGNGGITIDAKSTLSNVVVVANCDIKLSSSSVLDSSIIATTSTGARSINSPSSLQVGRNDNCAAGGSSKLLTMGSMNFASGLMVFGSQLLAKDNIEFAANADGIQGASLVAGGKIDGTSNMNMGFCGSGMENNYEAEYFRLAR